MSYFSTSTPRSGQGAALPDWSQQAVQRTWRTFGTLFVGIGIINAFINLWPSTVFLLMGLWAYGKAEPEMRERLLAHTRFGVGLRLWIDKRQISRKGKIVACVGIALSAVSTALMIGLKPITLAIVTGLGALCVYLASRAEPAVAP